MKKRILSLLLALAMVVGMTVPAVYAEETQTPNAPAQIGDEIAAAADAMEFPEDGSEVTKLCPVCNEEVLWKPLKTNATNWVNDKDNWTHWYVPSDVSASELSASANGAFLEAGSNFCLHLNNKTVEVTDSHVFNIGTHSTGNFMGKGTVRGNADTVRSSTISLIGSATANLYGGTYTKGEAASQGSSVLLIGSTNAGTVNIYGTTVIDGAGYLSTVPGSVYLATDSGAVNMYGGSITGGHSTAVGANVRVTAGTFTMNGGSITDGKITNEVAGNMIGGNVYVSGGKFIMNGGSITNVNQLKYGANVGIGGSGEFTMNGGSITGGQADFRGGNVYVIDSACNFTMNGGTISGGTATRGGDIYVVSNATFNGGSVSDVYMENTLTLAGTPVIAKLTVAEGKTFTVGDLHYGASIGVSGSRILSTNGNLQAEAQYFYGVVADGDLVVPTKTEGKLSYSSAKLPASLTNGGTAYCAACGKDVTWYMGVVTNTDGTFVTWNASEKPHGYLAANKTIAGDKITNSWNRGAALYAKVEGCFHLNGKTLDCQDTPAIWANTANGNLTILGSGTVIGKAAATYAAGAISVTSGPTVNLMGGTYKKHQIDGGKSSVLLMGSNNVGIFNIYRGAVIDGENQDSAEVSGSVYLANDAGVVNMYGGLITNGKSAAVGNLNVRKGTFNMYGGTIANGQSTTATSVNNVIVYANMFLYGGVIADSTNGDNLSITTTGTLTVDSSFTGDVGLYVAGATDFSNGAVIRGASTGAFTGTLKLENAENTPNVYGKDGKLIVCAHDWEAATCTTVKTCKVCGLTEGETLAHVYDQAIVAEQHLCSAATCTAKARYYKSCACGATGTVYFTAGEALNHSFTTYNSDENATCEADGTKTAICDREGCEAKDTIADEGSKLEHSFTGENGVCVNGCNKTTCDVNGHDYKTTYQNDGETHTVIVTCQNDANDVTTTPGQAHAYDQEGDKCVCGAEKPAPETNEAVVGDTKYPTLQAALDAAIQAGGGTVKLLKDTEVNANLTVNNGVTLDLNGNKLTVPSGKYVLACYNDSFITDTSANNAGRLVAEVAQLRLLDNNTQLPVKMSDGIMFVDAAAGNQKKDGGNFQCWIENGASQALIDALKATSASELALEFQVIVSWGNNSLKYTFKDATVSAYMENWQTLAMFLKLTGAEGIEDLTYQSRIVFADDSQTEVVVWSSSVIQH